MPMHPLIAARWSPRAMDPTVTLSDEQLTALLEAARWAPSYGNTQPARFLVGLRGTPTFDAIFATLNSGNKLWAHRAAVLLVAVALQRNHKGEVPYAEYGVGLAVENLVLQAVAEGMVAHQMAGFDKAAVREAFAVPEDAVPVVAIAVGGLGDAALLPADRRERETAPRRRLGLAELAFTGTWGSPLFRHHEPEQQVSRDLGAGQNAGQHEQQPHRAGVPAEVLRDPAAHAAEHPLR